MVVDIQSPQDLLLGISELHHGLLINMMQVMSQIIKLIPQLILLSNLSPMLNFEIHQVELLIQLKQLL